MTETELKEKETKTEEVLKPKNFVLELMEKGLDLFYTKEQKESRDRALNFLTASGLFFGRKIPDPLWNDFLVKVQAKQESGEWANATPKTVACWMIAECFGTMGHLLNVHQNEPEGD